VLDTTNALDAFLAGVERRAYEMARIATGSGEDALDIVQDAMYKLVERYADRPPGEWGPLFHRILQSRIMDWQRRSTLRRRFAAWLGRTPGDEEQSDPLDAVPDPRSPGPDVQLERTRAMAELERALRSLPRRQQQAFMLRTWEGFDVRETATAMRCSEGSVKTHYSRAVHALRERLKGYWP
jgi:RNA polymerase sigma-70 factor (ECF subfamily)